MALHVLATNIAQQDGAFEPQRQFNWTFEVTGIDGENDETLSISLAQGFLPRLSNEPIAVPYGNEVVYVAGKAMYDAGTLVCRDYCDRSTAGILLGWKTLVYNPLNGSIGLARNYKKEAFITLFGPNSTEQWETSGPQSYESGHATFMRRWRLVGCWPETVNCAGNGLDMAQNGQVMIEMVIRYDKAYLAGTGGGLGYTRRDISNISAVTL